LHSTIFLTIPPGPASEFARGVTTPSFSQEDARGTAYAQVRSYDLLRIEKRPGMSIIKPKKYEKIRKGECLIEWVTCVSAIHLPLRKMQEVAAEILKRDAHRINL
jgi:hypothetical protein